MLHELGAPELAVLHLLQLEFPVAGELGRSELGDAEMCSANISENAFGVGTSSRPLRCT